MIGEKFSHYKIIDKLGIGGMGEIFKAEDIKLKRTVALKFLQSSFSIDSEAKKRFIIEAQSASALDHPNICTIHEIGETVDGQLFISMPCYEGETLREKINRGALNIEEALDITLQICEGLKKAHKNKIIHRDIKPSNIFITKDGIVKILDFGLVKTKDRSDITKLGTTIGTINYMSPEQAKGEDVDQRTDIWALGVVMYEMLTCKLPFNGDYDQAIIYSILNKEPNLNNLPKEILPIIKKAIAKSPKERYQFTEEIITDLISLKSSATKKYHLLILPHRKSSKIALTLLLLIIFAVILYIEIKPFNNGPSVPKRKMIVVLPFENLGPPEDEYFAQGMREEISNKLAAFASLGVISRNSAEKYAGSKKSAKEIGKELGVDYILEGTLQWSKSKDKTSKVRIIPQLIKSSNDINIWSESYDRTITDIFEVQNEIAQNVVNKLGFKILQKQLSKNQPLTNNIDAYDYYLKANQIKYRVSSREDVYASLQLYKRAIALDSNFAAAYAQIAIAYMGIFNRFYDRNNKILENIQKNLQKAEELDTNLADVHLAKAFFYSMIKYDDDNALKEFNKTLEIQPNNAEVYESLGMIYGEHGKPDLDIKYSLKALSLDPLSSRYAESVGCAYQWQRNYENAEKYFNRAIELTPDFENYCIRLVNTYIDWKGNTNQPWHIYQKFKSKNSEMDNYLFIYLNIFDRHFNDAIKQLESSKTEYFSSGYEYIPSSLMLALVYNYMNEFDIAKEYFEHSKEQLEKKLISDTSDFRIHRSLSINYAGLKNKEKAINENRKAIELLPSTNQSVPKFIQTIDLANIYTLTGDYNNAFDQIDSLLSNPGYFSVNRLKLDPIYDPLRNLPRYKEIIDKY